MDRALAPTLVIAAVLALAGTLFAARAAPAPTAAPSPPAPTEKPYRPLAVTLAAAPADPSFAGFRAQLAAVARGRVYRELAQLVASQGFFWDHDFGGVYNRNKPAIENLAVAIGLEGGDGGGWRTLAAFAAEPTATPFGARPGIICAPGKPAFDDAEFEALLADTGTDGAAWAYPNGEGVPVRAAAAAGGAAIETLGLHFVRVLAFESKDGESTRDAWARIATPAGRIGYVAPGVLASPTAERLCYTKDITGRWRIAGFVGGGD